METEVLITDNRLKEDVQYLKEWASKQPHLPKIESEEWLKMCLRFNKYSIEKTKRKIENYYSFRNKYPAVLKNRDPLGSDIAQSRIAFNMSWADKLTKNGERLLFWKFHKDPSLYDAISVKKREFMLADLVHLERDKHSSVIIVIDSQHFTYQHFHRILPGLNISTDIFSNAYSDRVKAFHVIHSSYGTQTLGNAIMRVLPKKYSNNIFIHSSPVDLCKMVDEDIVCSDFGGKGPALSVYDEYTTKLLEKHRKWFLEQDNVCTNEKLRRKDDIEMMGSFRSLEVD